MINLDDVEKTLKNKTVYWSIDKVMKAILCPDKLEFEAKKK